MSEGRSRQLNIRLSEGERARLESAATKLGLSASAYLRMLICRETERLEKTEAAE